MQTEPVMRPGAPGGTLLSPMAAFASIAAAILVVLTVFWQTTLSMVEVWRASETFQHCFAVFPLALWLVWRDRDRLAASPRRAFLPGVAFLALLGATWLMGTLAEAPFVSQFALVGLIGAFIWTVFGTCWARIIWFPLAFLFFGVPFGEAVVPQLMEWTADVTVAALRLTGVPVYREGVHFVIPTGQWSVIEACSGIKFLIASLMAGSLYAWLMYRSTRRRVAFLVASLLVPLLANWLRAYAIVMIGHLSQNRLMTNEDHIVFGWFLFGAIMLAMYWLGARWREDDATATGKEAGTAGGAASWGAPAGSGLIAVWAVASAVLVIWPVVSHYLLAPPGDAGVVTIVPPPSAAGWSASAEQITDWKPDLSGSPSEASFYFDKGSNRVGVYLAVFRGQTKDSQLATTANQLVSSTNEQWQQTSRSIEVTTGFASAPESARSASLRQRRGGMRLALWQWYWVGGRATTSDFFGKWTLALARLKRQPDAGIWVAVFTPLSEDTRQANETLREFMRDMDASLRTSFDQTVGR